MKSLFIQNAQGWGLIKRTICKGLSLIKLIQHLNSAHQY